MSNTIELYYLREVTRPYGAAEYGEVIDSPYFVSHSAASSWAATHGWRYGEYAVLSVEVSVLD